MIKPNTIIESCRSYDVFMSILKSREHFNSGKFSYYRDFARSLCLLYM